MSEATQPDREQPGEKARRRRDPDYERVTPEKQELGRRLRYARELAGMSATEAAQALGYTQAVHVSEAEAGKRVLPLDKLMAAAQLFGVSVDFLCGLADDPDRDPVAGVQRQIAARIASEVQRLTEAMVESTVPLVRSCLPTVATGERLGGAVLELHAALARLRSKRPDFEDDMPSSAVIARLEAAVELAQQLSEQTARARRAQTIKAKVQAERAFRGPARRRSLKATEYIASTRARKAKGPVL